MKNEKQRLIFFFGAALLAVLFLSAGLSGMEMHSSTLYTPQGYAELILLFEMLTSRAALTAALLCLGPALLFSIAVMIATRDRRGRLPRKRSSLLVYLDALLWTMAVLVVARILQQRMLENAQNNLQNGETIGPESLPTIQIDPDPSTTAAVSIGFLLLASVAAVIWLVWKRTRPQTFTLQRLSKEAEIALHTIQTGGDLRSTILRCYAEMCHILNENKGIVRQDAMTPREFEGRLLQAGLPEEPVRQLTRLFESVRYGAAQPDSRQEHLAVDCLTAIAESSRRPA
ncbi:MAG: DUF4129 domain-containing protein [Chloroflexi bacterium]|jgi:anaerobic C4-dicarboxylate transporter|nr:DUF4129 domain-containing protein [Chloroflexota bacterium]